MEKFKAWLRHFFRIYSECQITFGIDIAQRPGEYTSMVGNCRTHNVIFTVMEPVLDYGVGYIPPHPCPKHGLMTKDDKRAMAMKLSIFAMVVSITVVAISIMAIVKALT